MDPEDRGRVPSAGAPRARLLGAFGVEKSRTSQAASPVISRSWRVPSCSPISPGRPSALPAAGRQRPSYAAARCSGKDARSSPSPGPRRRGPGCRHRSARDADPVSLHAAHRGPQQSQIASAWPAPTSLPSAPATSRAAHSSRRVPASNSSLSQQLAQARARSQSSHPSSTSSAAGDRLRTRPNGRFIDVSSAREKQQSRQDTQSCSGWCRRTPSRAVRLTFAGATREARSRTGVHRPARPARA